MAFLSSYKFPILLLVNILIFIFFASILPIRFEENDDVMMLLFASGAYTGFPEAHLVYINYLYGLLLVGLYTLLPGIEWYTVLFCVIHVLSLTVVAWLILTSNNKTGFKITYLLVFYSIEICTILLFQFTTTAAICAIAALMLIATNEKKALKTTGVLMFALAFLIRYEAASLVLILMLPLFAWQLYTTRAYNKILVPLFFCILLACVAKIVDKSVYSKDKDWAEYAEFNSERGFINANPNRSNIYDKLPEDVSANDYFLLLSYFSDGKTIDADDLKEINELKYNISIKDKLRKVYPSLRTHFKFLIPISIIFIVLIIGNRKQKDKAIFLFIYALLYLSLLSVLSLDVTLKYRVFLSTLYPVFFVLFYMTSFSRKNKISTALIVLSCAIFIVAFNGKSYKTQLAKDKKNASFSYETKQIVDRAKAKDIVILPYAADLSVENYNPFRLTELMCCRRFVSLGWLTNIPFNKTMINDYRDIVDLNIGVFVSRANEEKIIPHLQQSLKENYDYHTDLMYIDETEHYLMIKLIQKHAEEE